LKELSINNLFEKVLIESELPIKKISELALIEGNSKKPVYEIHKWWARRLNVVVRSILLSSLLPNDTSEKEFWEKYYSTNSYNDLTVLDCFMGGGTSLVEAKKIGAKTIGVDIDPLACFITKKELEKCDYNAVEEYLKHLKDKVGAKIEKFYLTESEGTYYPIINVFWVYQVECDSCGRTFDTHPHYKLYHGTKEQYVFCKDCGEIGKINCDEKIFECTHCYSKTEIENGTYNRGYCYCPTCGNKQRLTDLFRRTKKLKMFALEYEKDSQRIFKKADLNDQLLFNSIEEEAQKVLKNYFIPSSQIPIDNNRPITYGYIYYKDLFNSRQLLSLAIIFNEISSIPDNSLREWLLIGFSDCLASNNLLCNYAYGYRKLTPLFGIHAYTVPVRPVENNVWGSKIFGRGTFTRTIKKLIKAKQYCENVYESKLNKKEEIAKVFTGERITSKVTSNPENFYSGEYDSLILNQSSINLDLIRDNTIDIILTDPPYYDNLHYSELADFYYQWLKGKIENNAVNPLTEALYVNSNEKKGHKKFEAGLKLVFKECYKKLKQNGLMIFSYHHNKTEAWEVLGKAIKESGFLVTNVFPLRSEGKSGYHSTDNSIKWDSIIVLRKSEKSEPIVDEYESLKNLISYWEKYIFDKKLGMKKCDKLSFYRSLAVMVYSQYKKANFIKLIETILSEQAIA
jgi:adenine-specific DNA methylase